jgi:hypothetical protein
MAAALNAWLLAGKPFVLAAVLLILAGVASYILTRPNPGASAPALH